MSKPLSQRNGADPFADFRKPKNRRTKGECRRCGTAFDQDELGGRVVVTLQGRRFNPEKAPGDSNRWAYPSVDSNSATLCAGCAVEIYGTLVELLRADVGTAGGLS